MTKFIFGKKLGMSTIYDEKLGALNVTLVECAPNVVTQIRTSEKDNYEAIQVGLKKLKAKSDKLKVNNFEKIREFKSEAKDLKVGDELTVDQFKIGDKVKISTKGRYGVRLMLDLAINQQQGFLPACCQRAVGLQP